MRHQLPSSLDLCSKYPQSSAYNSPMLISYPILLRLLTSPLLGTFVRIRSQLISCNCQGVCRILESLLLLMTLQFCACWLHLAPSPPSWFVQLRTCFWLAFTDFQSKFFFRCILRTGRLSFCVWPQLLEERLSFLFRLNSYHPEELVRVFSFLVRGIQCHRVIEC